MMSKLRALCGKAEWLIIPVVIVGGLSYLSDPLAMAPQLDAKENLYWAALIQKGEMPMEPLFRAMLYPWLISLVPLKAIWPAMIVLAGLLLHIAAAFQVRHLAGTVWQSSSARRFSFILYTLNPVSLFFALQGMDMTLAIVLFLGAVQLLLAGQGQQLSRLFGAGVLAGLACLARPHFLPVSLLLFLVPLLSRGSPFTKRGTSAMTLLSGVCLMLMLQGAINASLSGEFRILPWQGAYNLYAANRPGANGLYYKQVLDVSSEQYANPARMESEQLYMMETGARPPLSIDEMNAYWRDQTRDLIFEDPLRLIQLGAFKAYAILNSYEQYNNLTYAFHKSRIPFLRYNPLNWGIFMVLAGAGALLLIRRNPGYALLLALLIAGYSISLLLYYASARFRLPLVPFLAILSGGIMTLGLPVKETRREWIPASLLALLMGCISFSSLGNIRNTDTFIQDTLLLANANADLGRDVEAARHAHSVLWENPHRREAQRIYTVSYFNLRLLSDPGWELFGSWETQRQWVRQATPTDPVQDTILGVYHWMWGNGDRALEIWRGQVSARTEGAGLSMACLAAAGAGPDVPPELQQLKQALENLFKENALKPTP